MATTNFMNIDLPTVSVTLGPEWATEINAAITTIDEHDHTSGKGTTIPTAGLNINADLSYNSSYKATDLLSTQYTSQGATLTGASNINSVYAVSGNLYFTNGSGTAVQVTDGGALVATPSTFSTLELTDRDWETY